MSQQTPEKLKVTSVTTDTKNFHPAYLTTGMKILCVCVGSTAKIDLVSFRYTSWIQSVSVTRWSHSLTLVRRMVVYNAWTPHGQIFAKKGGGGVHS